MEMSISFSAPKPDVVYMVSAVAVGPVDPAQINHPEGTPALMVVVTVAAKTDHLLLDSRVERTAVAVAVVRERPHLVSRTLVAMVVQES